MSEHVPEEHEEPAVPAEAAEPVRTGHPQVDEVLASLDGLDDRPVDEHVAVFERAHDALRGALDARPED